MVLLRLVKVPCPEPLLNLWLEVDIDYVNSLISLATRHTGPLDSFVLDTVLDPDRWTLSLKALGTSHDLRGPRCIAVSTPSAPVDVARAFGKNGQTVPEVLSASASQKSKDAMYRMSGKHEFDTKHCEG